MADAVDMQPLWKSEPGKWDFAQASHLLQRAGFGGSVAEVQALVAMGPEKAVDSLISYRNRPDSLPPMHFGELSGPVENPRERARLYRGLTAPQRRAMQQLQQGARSGRFEQLKLWWLDRMVRTTRPLEEKMTLFWHGILVSSYATVRNTYALYVQNQLFRRHATGNFRDLIVGVSKDPAMLEYLNNNQNRKAKPNENYARELMELFTMGIGNYTENDIKASARAFTGWTFAGDAFVFNPREHDTGPKTFLGRTGNFDGHDIIRMIFEQPATARYIASRLVRFFAVDEPPPAAIDSLASVLRSSGYEIAPALAHLFSARWFYSREVMRTQIKSPVQLVVGSLRMLGLNITEPRPVDQTLRMMGQELFNAPTVKGWDGGRSWINTSTLFARYNLPAYLVTGRLPTAPRRAGGDTAMEARQQFAEFHSPFSPQLDLADAGVSTTDGLVDYYLRRLIQDRIEPRKRAELVEFVNGTGDAKSRVFDPTGPDAEKIVRSLVHLVMSMAEYQIC